MCLQEAGSLATEVVLEIAAVGPRFAVAALPCVEYDAVSGDGRVNWQQVANWQS